MPRRPLTDTQREILQAERSARRLEAVRTSEASVRDIQHTEARVARESRLRRGRRSEASIIAGREAVISGAAETITPPKDQTNIVLVVIFTMAMLIIVYKLVTSGPQLSGLLRGASDWLAALSTTQPLFTSKSKVT